MQLKYFSLSSNVRVSPNQIYELRHSLLLGSMYFWSWLIQLNRSYKYNENIARTGISTLNGHISKTVIFFEKWKKILVQLFFNLGSRVKGMNCMNYACQPLTS